MIDWRDSAHDAAVRRAGIAITRKWETLAEERGLHVPFLYMNDASRDQNPLASYGEQNVQKLKVVSRTYDPFQLFQKLQNDGFLLRKA